MCFRIALRFCIFTTIVIGIVVLYNIDSLIPSTPELDGPPPEVVLQSFLGNEITKCTQKKNIVFIKTHKTAGTSIQNILLRYAFKNQLTVALPVLSNTHIFESSRNFSREMLQLAPWRLLGYNIFCHHMVYNENALKEVMPFDSIYITILRNPVSVFESYYEYSNLREKLNISLERFASLTTEKGAIEKLCRQRKVALPQNLMLKDFGVLDTMNTNYVNSIIDHIDKKFTLVLITEYFDQSVVLLKELLCWDNQDVVSFTVNARRQTYKQNLSSIAISHLVEWNKQDMTFYQFFLRKLQRQIALFGKVKMQQGTSDIVKARHSLYDSCIDQVVPSESLTQFKFWTPKVLGFKLKQNTATCVNLVKPEKEITNDIRMKQLWLSLPDNVANNLKRLSNLSSFSLNESVLKSVNKVLKKHTNTRKTG